MKQAVLLCIAMSLFVLAGGQANINESFSAGTPNDWIFGQGMQLKSYNNPLTNCALDQGYVTPGIGGNNPSYVGTAPVPYDASMPSILVSFKMFVFNANLDCSSMQPFPCQVYFTIYLVKSTYTSNAPPPASEIYGQTVPQMVNANAINSVIFTPSMLSPDLTSGTYYRAYFDFSIPVSNCNQSGIKYVLDDIRVLETSNIILPVSLKSFSAMRNRNNVELRWETASEQENTGFYVQRKAGGNNWENLSFIPTKAPGGNSQDILTYTYSDINTSKGLLQYRIRQVDRNGKDSYSLIRYVRSEGMAGQILIFPNPSVDGRINISFDESSLRQILVNDAAGRLIKKYEGVTGNSFTIENLQEGVYLIQVTDRITDATLVEKVVIKKR